jgi:hypothetical protein
MRDQPGSRIMRNLSETGGAAPDHGEHAAVAVELAKTRKALAVSVRSLQEAVRENAALKQDNNRCRRELNAGSRVWLLR